MADPRSSTRADGFSMVEMLVALVFTMVLMAGMATVFKASLSTFFTSGERTASGRRNRMSLDLLGQDLNSANMYLANITNPPLSSSGLPPFYIVPNMAITGAPTGPASINPLTADQVYFQLDQPTPFEGTIQPGGGADSAAAVIGNLGGVIPASNTVVVECGSAANAALVVGGQNIIFKDTYQVGYIKGTPSISNTSQVTVTLGADSNAFITGGGGTGLPLQTIHGNQTKIVFVQPAQIIRYQVQYLNLDPENANSIPCLVRDLGTYIGGVFTPNAGSTQEIVADNVQGFKAYLSVNSGQSWAGLGKTYTTLANGWTGGIQQDLVTQLKTMVTNGFTSITGNANWFRSIPTLVRLDVTTRTATQRTEYYTANDPNNPTNIANPYKNTTQTLVFVPRHSGLPLD
jgi:hypothetical protein